MKCGRQLCHGWSLSHDVGSMTRMSIHDDCHGWIYMLEMLRLRNGDTNVGIRENVRERGKK